LLQIPGPEVLLDHGFMLIAGVYGIPSRAFVCERSSGVSIIWRFRPILIVWATSFIPCFC